MYILSCQFIGLPLEYLLSTVVTEVTRKGLARNPFSSAGAYFLWTNDNCSQPRRWAPKPWEIESYQHLKFSQLSKIERFFYYSHSTGKVLMGQKLGYFGVTLQDNRTTVSSLCRKSAPKTSNTSREKGRAEILAGHAFCLL